MTAQDVVDQALSKLGVIAPGEPPSSDERARGLVVLNEIVACWNDVLKRTLAGCYAADLYTFTALASYDTLATTLTVSAGWQRAFVYALAVDLAPEFGRTVAPEVAAIAEKAKMAVVTLPAPVL